METIAVLEDMGFENPTPIQEKAIPILLENPPSDFIGLAQTGTGKTAAFGLPLVEVLNSESRSVQALIMSPTRELAQQIAQQLRQFSSNNRSLQVEVVYGGANIVAQIKAVKKSPQIVVATPGRLLDLIKRKAILLEHVSYVVLDEADEMLNMGFKEDIDEILSHTNDDRVTWLFSATMPSAIRSIVNKYMKDPNEISILTKERINKDIIHKYVVTKTANKISALRRFLDIQPDMRGIMFCRTKRETQQIADDLGNMGYEVEALHGDLSQAQRDGVMRRFKKRAMQLLIATDVAARGIDVDDLTHVMHHTLPDHLDSYTHRSGRTARAGKKGISLSFINPREGKRIKELENRIKVTFEKIDVPHVNELKYSRINNWANLILNTEVNKEATDVLKHLKGQFADLTKEDLLERLVSSQIDHLSIYSNEQDDLNESHELGGRSGRQGRRDSGDSSRSNRYFVNIGLIDGVTKGDLVHFLSEVSGVQRKHFGQISLQKNCAFFEIDSSEDTKLSSKFKGIEIEGRKIRVNKDEGARSSSEGGKGDYKKRGDKKGRGRPKKDYSKKGPKKRY